MKSELLTDGMPDRPDPGRARRLVPRFAARLLLLTMLVPVMVVGVAWRGYRHVIPAGTAFYPVWAFLEPVREGPRLVSPHGTRTIQVMFNDAGAAHSGNHWTWLIVDHWLTGKQVVAEGYSLPDVRDQDRPFPLRWADDRTVAVTFIANRHGEEPRSHHRPASLKCGGESTSTPRPSVSRDRPSGWTLGLCYNRAGTQPERGRRQSGRLAWSGCPC